MNYYAAFLKMVDQEKSQHYRNEHLDYLKQLTAEGKVFAKGRFTDGAGGLVIYQAESLEEATALAEKDPYIETGARSLEIHEWDMITE